MAGRRDLAIQGKLQVQRKLRADIFQRPDGRKGKYGLLPDEELLRKMVPHARPQGQAGNHFQRIGQFFQPVQQQIQLQQHTRGPDDTDLLVHILEPPLEQGDTLAERAAQSECEGQLLLHHASEPVPVREHVLSVQKEGLSRTESSSSPAMSANRDSGTSSTMA